MLSILALAFVASGMSLADPGPIGPPSEAVLARFKPDDQTAAPAFYGKYLDVGGVAILASATVDDEALRRTHLIVTHLLAGRPDILGVMATWGTRLIIIGRDQVYTDMPEYRATPDPAYMNERVRGTGGLDVTSFGDRPRKQQYEPRVRRLDVEFDARSRAAFDAATARGLWRGTAASRDRVEYWVMGMLAYFDAAGDPARVPAPNDAERPIVTREALRAYDPELDAIVAEVMAYQGHSDWRYAR